MPLDPRIKTALAALPSRPDVTGTPAQRRAEAAARAAQLDGVLSTKAPTYMVRHPRHLAFRGTKGAR